MLEGTIWPTFVCLSSKWTTTQMKKTDANIDRSIKSSAVGVKKQMKYLQMYAQGCIQDSGKNLYTSSYNATI